MKMQLLNKVKSKWTNPYIRAVIIVAAVFTVISLLIGGTGAHYYKKMLYKEFTDQHDELIQDYDREVSEWKATAEKHKAELKRIAARRNILKKEIESLKSTEIKKPETREAIIEGFTKQGYAVLHKK